MFSALAVAVAGALLLVTPAAPAAAARETDLAATVFAVPATCPVVVKNGGFEDSPLGANWTQVGASNLISDFATHSGTYAAYLGGLANSDHSIRQKITLPAQRPLRVSFWWSQTTTQPVQADFDTLTVRLLNSDGTSTLATLGVLEADPEMAAWDLVEYDVSAYSGQTVWLEFQAKNDETWESHFFVDDVKVASCYQYLPITTR
jgi:hypothetical protein